MKSSENETSQETKTEKNITHSEEETQFMKDMVTVPPAAVTKPQLKINLKPYEYDPKDLESFVKKFELIDPVADMKAAKKARSELKKKISEIKKVHLHNKKVILEFKRDVEAYDFGKFEVLTADLTSAFTKLNTAIEKIENAASIRENEIITKINNLNNKLLNDIMNATDIAEIQSVQAKIAAVVPDPNEFDNRVGEVSSLITSLTLKAAGRANEIVNAGGKISNEVPIDLKGGEMFASMGTIHRKYTDTELLNIIQGSAAQKGWAVMINPHPGVQIYQVDDPKAPKDIRVALENAIVKHKGS